VKLTASLLALVALLVIALPSTRHALLELGSPAHRHSDENLLSPPPPDFQEYLNRAEARSAIANEVLAERMTLVEAADAYLDLLGERAPQLLPFIPGQSAREKMCRQVISVVASIENDRGLGPKVSQKLEAELMRRLAEEARAWESRAVKL